jgi:hypothetical protein
MESLERLDHFLEGARHHATFKRMSPRHHEVENLELDEATRIGNIILTVCRASAVQANMITACLESVEADLGEDDAASNSSDHPLSHR